MEVNFQIKNLSNADIESFRKLLEDLIAFSQQRLKYDQPVKVLFISDPENAINTLGKTAHYAPATKTITIYVDNRHPKDMLRSVAHELVHHAQNCRGDFDEDKPMKDGYAQEDGHLREMEREAYEVGNLCFRDFEDGIKTNKKKETIYIKVMTEGLLMKSSLENIKNIIKEEASNIREGWVTMPAVDHCKGNCKSEAEASKQCGGVGVSLQEYDGGGGYMPFEADSGGGGILNWLTRSLRVREGAGVDKKKLKEIVRSVLQQEAAVNCVFGGPKIVVPEGTSPQAVQAAGAFSNDVTEPDPHYKKGCVDRGYVEGIQMNNGDKKLMKEDKKGWSSLKTLNKGWNKFMNESWGEDDYMDDLEEEFPWLSKSVKAKEIPDEVAQQLAKEFGDKEAPEEEEPSGKRTLKQVGREKREMAGMEPDPRYAVNEYDVDDPRTGKDIDGPELDVEGVDLEPEEGDSTGDPKEDTIRKIVTDKQAADIDGVTLDLYTASAIVKVLDAINDQNKEKYLAMDVANMADIAWKMLK